MFPCIEALIRLLLVNPASSATAERSFSSLRRLKTYLRATCGQKRLNNLSICHVHKDVVDELDVNELMKEFILCRDARSNVFGHIDSIKKCLSLLNYINFASLRNVLKEKLS